MESKKAIKMTEVPTGSYVVVGAVVGAIAGGTAGAIAGSAVGYFIGETKKKRGEYE